MGGEGTSTEKVGTRAADESEEKNEEMTGMMKSRMSGRRDCRTDVAVCGC